MRKKKPKKKTRKRAEPKSIEDLSPMDPRAMEKTTWDIGKLLEEQDFSSIEEANAFLQNVIASGKVPSPPRHTPVEQAQDLMYEAWGSSGKKRMDLARRALEISKDCADAYVLLAEETARNLNEAKELYEQGVKAGERALGPQVFEEGVGHFWGITETRPYMRARVGLAQCLWGLDERKKAIEHYTDMLRLNPGDNQGIRYILINCLLSEGDDEAAGKLLDEYKDDGAATWLYSRLLLTFRQEGAGRKVNRQLKDALKYNPNVPLYLLGIENIPKRLPEYSGFGDENEAIYYTVEAVEVWVKTPGALKWLANNLLKEAKTAGIKPEEKKTALSKRSSDIYQIKVTLKGSRPPIWRRFQVKGETSLYKLHLILQALMGWENYHLYEFRIGETYFGEPDSESFVEMENAHKVKLSQIVRDVKQKFSYDYDFGDNWEHEILIEKILPPETGTRYPICIDGKRACPPEDCGGIWGYEELLETIKDPNHPRYKEMMEWLVEAFDPEAFDMDQINRELKRIR